MDVPLSTPNFCMVCLIWSRDLVSHHQFAIPVPGRCGFVARIEHPLEGVSGDLHASCRAVCRYLSIQMLSWYCTVIELPPNP